MKDLKENKEVETDSPLNESASFSGEVGPREIENLNKFAKQMNAAFQKDIHEVLHKIERELNKYAYTLGPLDLEGIEDADGEDEDFLIFSHATMEYAKNLFLTLKWETLSSGQQYALRPDGAALFIRATLSFNRVDPEDFDELFGDIDLESRNSEELVDYSGDSEVMRQDPARVRD